jgi:diguanylate cyclase (GGDEF)-like protein
VTRIWKVWLLAGALAIVGYFLLPHSWVSGVYYDAIGAASAAAIAIAARARRTARPLMWYLFSAGQATWVVGDLIYTWYENVLHQQPFPSPADIFYLAAYPILIAGLFVLVRRRGERRDPTGLLDATIVAVGIGLVLWTLLMRPIALDATLSVIAKACSLAYPFFDLLMLAVIARLITKRGSRTASYRLLVAAVLMLLASDVGFSLLTTFSTYSGGALDAGWMASYVLWAAAALHPSAADPLSTEEIATGHRRQTVRLAVLAVMVLVCPGVLLVEGLSESSHIDWLGIGVGAAVLCGLVLLRSIGLLGQIRVQAGELERLAMHDELTGLANRRLLRRHLSAVAGQPAQLVLIDLDDFKIVNDRLGHAVGDELIAVVASRLVASAPAATVARLGGDEFAILLPGMADAAADALVERVLIALHEPVRAGGVEILVRASAGAAGGLAQADGAHADGDLLRRADIAMYAAKAGGLGYLRYDPSLDESANAEARLRADLRAALDRGAFSLAYQPIVALPAGEIVGVEALVRWEEMPYGPADFVPAAERDGLIVELGEWVLWSACRQQAAWTAALGPAAPRRISVNVSPRQLREPGFAATVAQILERTGVPPRQLVVEVTETAVFDSEPALRTLHALSALGVRVALDDFGTGHSSLGLLQTCPVDILKVDKSFVDTITSTGRHAVIASALITVSNGLGLTAIAEGVETPAQADHLFALGYQYAQGYHFGRPTTAAAITETLLAHRVAAHSTR